MPLSSGPQDLNGVPPKAVVTHEDNHTGGGAEDDLTDWSLPEAGTQEKPTDIFCPMACGRMVWNQVCP